MLFVSLTSQDYVERFARMPKGEDRQRMKMFAFSAMYSSDPNAKVLLPLDLAMKLPPLTSDVTTKGSPDASN